MARVIRQAVQPPYLIIDGRRMIADNAELIAAGYDFLSVGGVTHEGVTAAGETAEVTA
jgi:UDPglucose 6-dehydrogenase